MAINVNFDMDGTLYDLYSLEDWLEGIVNGVKGYYTNGATLVNMWKLSRVCRRLQKKGIKVNIITWTQNTENGNAIELAKKEKLTWLRKKMPYADTINILPYGTPKSEYMEDNVRNILFDDNDKVREEWENKGGIAYTEKNILTILREMDITI